MRRSFWLGLAVVAALGLACSSDNNNNPPPDSGTPDSGTPDSGTPGPTITITGFTFSPTPLTVDAGSTITVKNTSGSAHTVTSESAENDFTPGAVNGVSFDTGSISAGGTATFNIPANAPSGTDIPYYCKFHQSGMTPANPHIIVR